jgi:hypothetical protein
MTDYLVRCCRFPRSEFPDRSERHRDRNLPVYTSKAARQQQPVVTPLVARRPAYSACICCFTPHRASVSVSIFLYFAFLRTIVLALSRRSFYLFIDTGLALSSTATTVLLPSDFTKIIPSYGRATKAFPSEGSRVAVPSLCSPELFQDSAVPAALFVWTSIHTFLTLGDDYTIVSFCVATAIS